MEQLSSSDSESAVVTDPKDAAVGKMLLALIQSLIDVEDELEIVPIVNADGVSFRIHTATQDLGKLIGRNGRTARAIRTILSGNAAKHKRRYSVDFGGRSTA
jgi:predicted RNA-binding protein YlqC (UPF0109 family)